MRSAGADLFAEIVREMPSINGDADIYHNVRGLIFDPQNKTTTKQKKTNTPFPILIFDLSQLISSLVAMVGDKIPYVRASGIYALSSIRSTTVFANTLGTVL